MRTRQSRVPLCAFALLFTPLVAARADFNDGKRAYEQGDYKAALRELKPLAERGNPEAEALLGLMYQLGRGVPMDTAQAENWYKAAADQGNAEAECQLGSLHLKKDPAQALKQLKLSAEQGFSDCYLILGLAYMNLNTKDLPRDFVQADMWFNLAVAHGDPMAESQRAICERRMSRDQILKARALAEAWKPKTTPSSDQKDEQEKK